VKSRSTSGWPCDSHDLLEHLQHMATASEDSPSTRRCQGRSGNGPCRTARPRAPAAGQTHSRSASRCTCEDMRLLHARVVIENLAREGASEQHDTPHVIMVCSWLHTHQMQMLVPPKHPAAWQGARTCCARQMWQECVTWTSTNTFCADHSACTRKGVAQHKEAAFRLQLGLLPRSLLGLRHQSGRLRDNDNVVTLGCTRPVQAPLG